MTYDELPARFHAKTSVNDETECIEWNAYTNRKGYGVFGVEGRKTALAHRVAYEAENGQIPVGLVIDHLCRVRNCVNPKHMEAVTQKENVQRGMAGKHQLEKTHCPQGHEYAGDNLYVYPPGSVHAGDRRCRTCADASHKRRRERKGSAL